MSPTDCHILFHRWSLCQVSYIVRLDHTAASEGGYRRRRTIDAECCLVPFTLAAPAAAVGLAYLNAQMALSYDINMLFAMLKANVVTVIQEKLDRINLFYTFEDHALSSYGNSPFLLYNGQQWTYKETYDIALK